MADNFSSFAASRCNEEPPTIDMQGSAPITLQGPYINGFQANYSCRTGCNLEGSPSLRCISSMWQLENETLMSPTCNCKYSRCTCTCIFM